MNISFINGCFDLLHPGHLLLLEQPKYDFPDIPLFVAINSDASIRKLKGKGRPLIDELQRKRMLEALSCVDEVLTFDELNCVNVLRVLEPRWWYKGASYKGKIDPEEERVAELLGTEVVYVKEIERFSTTKLLDKIKEVC